VRTERGYTLVEVVIVVTLMSGIVLFAMETSSSITSASSYGRRLLRVQSENQESLWRIANDLQNASSDTDPVTNEPRFEIIDDVSVLELKTRTAENLAIGDTSDTILGTKVVSAGVVDGDGALGDNVVIEEDIAANTAPVDDVKTIGALTLQETEESEIIEGRPRLMKIAQNSRFTFRKVVGYNANPSTGEVSKIWSTPVSYYVRGRQLIREQDGQTQVIGHDISAFKVFGEDKGNFRVFLRSQVRNPETGEVVTASGSVEVNPKNR
jgi:prepilin-type N-terminal cleavage/methylation domain-containing protein